MLSSQAQRTYVALHSRLVWRSPDHYGLLSEAREQLASAARSAPIEPKGELVEVVVQVLETYGSLMGAQQPALQQRDDPMNARQQFGRRFLLAPQEGDPVAVAVPLQGLVAQPPVRMHDAASSIESCTKGIKLEAEASAMRRIRIRPIPRPSSCVATTIKAFFSVCRPRTPSSRPPRYVSSTSTVPVSRSRPGLTIARRSLCSQAQAVW